MKNSQMVISEDDEFTGEDSDPKTIYLIGNVESFQSLMHIMTVSLNMLVDKINISQLPFIQNKLNKQFLINIDYENEDTSTGPLIDSGDKITWYLNGITAGIVATTIHGLGYAYKTYDFIPDDNESTHVIDCLLV